MHPLSAHSARALRDADAMDRLTKLAAQFPGDTEVMSKTTRVKRATIDGLFTLLKQACQETETTLESKLANIGADLSAFTMLRRGQVAKLAASRDALTEESVEKLATIGVVEGMLDAVDAHTLTPETRKVANEIRTLNHAYAAQLFCELSR